jgi:sodium/hydrogen antiporter
LTFLAFGAVLLEPVLADLSWRVAIYAVLSLTVVRMVPVALALLGSHARLPTVAFVGWFGPRGLASIVFAVLIVEEAQLPHVSTILQATYVMESAPVADQRPGGPVAPPSHVAYFG